MSCFPSTNSFVAEDFKSLSPLSDECDAATNSDGCDEDEFSEMSSLSPSTPNSPIPNRANTNSVTPIAAASKSQTQNQSGPSSASTTPASSFSSTSPSVGVSLLPLIERPRRMTKRDQLERLDVLELVKKTRKLTTEEKKEFQRLRRRKQNRDAAATSRDRKRDYTTSLESTIKAMQDKQTEMQRIIDNLLKERETLLKQLKEVEGQQIQPMNITSCVPLADEKSMDSAKRGKKRALTDCVNDSTASTSSSALNSSLPLIASAEPAGDGGSQSNQQETNVMMQVSQTVDVVNTISEHLHLPAHDAAPVTVHAESKSDNGSVPAAKRSKVDVQQVSTSTVAQLVETSLMAMAGERVDDLASPASGCAVADLTLEGLEAQLFDHSLPLSEAESIGNLSSLSASAACDLLESQANNFLTFTSLQREDSLGAGMCLNLNQDALPLQEKSFAAHDFEFAAFNDLQTV